MCVKRIITHITPNTYKTKKPIFRNYIADKLYQNYSFRPIKSDRGTLSMYNYKIY